MLLILPFELLLAKIENTSLLPTGLSCNSKGEAGELTAHTNSVADSGVSQFRNQMGGGHLRAPRSRSNSG